MAMNGRVTYDVGGFGGGRGYEVEVEAVDMANGPRAHHWGEGLV